MMRFLALGGAFCVCLAATGCSTETYDDLIKDTIKRVGDASVDVGNIKGRVLDAIKNVKDGKTPNLNLADAVEAAKALKKTGEDTQKLKRRIELVRGQVTDDQRKEYAASHKGSLNTAMKELLQQKAELQAALTEAEQLDPSNTKSKSELARFRAALRDAESPFEALAR